MDTINTKYKSNLFEDYYSDKERLLDLYKAIARSKDINKLVKEDIKLNNIKRVLTSGDYNDVSFMLKNKLVIIIEHQSTLNNNMPVRLLLYYALILNNYLETTKLSEKEEDKTLRSLLYSKKAITFPKPEFYVLYNGKGNIDSKVLKLSDSYNKQISGYNKKIGLKNKLELIVDVIDIKYETKDDILSRSSSLNDYSKFNYLFQKNKQQMMVQSSSKNSKKISIDALKSTINECINKGIMENYLKERGVSIMLDILSKELEIEGLLYDAKLEGLEQGKLEGKLEDAKRMLSKGFSIEIISECIDLSIEQIQELIN